jgi:glutamate synthase domain-containing protein 2
MRFTRILLGAGAAVAGVAVRDVTQKRHSLLRAFPVLGHARYLMEAIGPEMRQYIVADNNEERPFNRDQRRYIYASSKGVNNYFGFGTDNDLEHSQGYPIIKQRTFSTVAPSSAEAHHADDEWLPAAKVLGAARGRREAFRPNSVVNISAMSFGSLSAPAVEALNKGAATAGCLHNTGEGGLSQHHRHGGELVLQVGTAYFGCRDAQGRFDLDKLLRVVESAPVKAIEVKLSQGAKPGLGGLLPAAKITEEIADIRGIRMGEACVSPSRHTAFSDVDSMLDWVETVADATGVPVGIKSAVGDQEFFEQLAEAMADGSRGVEFITIDGGEGGTGAAPLVFADHVSLPLRLGFPKAYTAFARRGIADRVTFIAAGKLGLPENALVAFAMGADMVNVAREAMLAIGCLQTLKCHTDHCPTGVATQNSWLARSLDPDLKGERTARYVGALRRDLNQVAESAGILHPALITAGDIDMLYGHTQATPLTEVLQYEPGWGQPSQSDIAELSALLGGPSRALLDLGPPHPGRAVDRS